jgi:hypothetical protein
MTLILPYCYIVSEGLNSSRQKGEKMMAAQKPLLPTEKTTSIKDSSRQVKRGAQMNTYRKTAIIVGALFLIAMVASLLGGSLVEAVLSAPDYLAVLSENGNQVIIGVFLELINGIAVVGIGVLMFPVLRRFNESMALGYLALRIVEGVFCSVIVISPLSLLTLSHDYLESGASDASYYQAVGALSMAERANVSGLLIPLFLGLGALLFYSLLYQSKLLPRYIPVWGLIAVVLILALNILLTLNVDVGGMALVFALPIILNEIYLGIWLIIKGFTPSALASKPAVG